MSQDDPTRSQDTTSLDGAAGFLSNIFTPGSSLNPTFLLMLDGAFALLLCVFLGLLVLTRGNFHIIALIVIEGCLWASVKWYVHGASPMLGRADVHAGSWLNCNGRWDRCLYRIPRRRRRNSVHVRIQLSVVHAPQYQAESDPELQAVIYDLARSCRTTASFSVRSPGLARILDAVFRE